MKITIDILFYAIYSVLVALLAYYISKIFRAKKLDYNKQGIKIRLFFINYPWFVAVISFLFFI